MSIKKVCLEEIINEKRFERCLDANYIRVEGCFFVQYECNPTPDSGMKKISPEVTDFIAHGSEVNGKIYSWVIETIGEETSTTYHYQV